MTDFTHFIGIDWTGARGQAHAGLAVAMCALGEGTPRLVAPPSGKSRWSREECASWILAGMGLPKAARALVGLDSSFGMPFADEGRYLAGIDLPDNAVDLWAHVDNLCGDAPDLYGGPFVDAHARFYLRTGAKGDAYSRRMRVAERLAVESGAGPCESVFHLIGPSQVGLSGLSTMRMLARLAGQDNISVWPFDTIIDTPVTVIEIYAAAFASLGGHRGKVRGRAELAGVLKGLGVPRPRVPALFSDHAADAIVTAAALRHIAHDRKYWNPAELSTMVRRTEGWVFGIE